MFRKILTLALVVIMVQTASFVAPISAAPDDKDEALAQKVKADVMRFGLQTRVTVKFKDNTSQAGVIDEIRMLDFIITDARSKTPTTIAYQEVKQVSRNGFSTGQKIGIGLGVAGAAALIIAVLAGRNKKETPCGSAAQVGVPCPPGCVCALR